ncbi:LamG domain-containing protein [Mesorhizobium australicum]|uniref:LamG domain-containing protein n=1 Tax=Mesorhizobium australicum TaxID=536018 RepID=UPI003338A77A
MGARQTQGLRLPKPAIIRPAKHWIPYEEATFPFPLFSPTGGSAPVTDPYFANVVLLLGFEGTNGATATTDESLSAHAMSFQGNAQIDTSQKKMGTASLLLDGTADYLTFPATNDLLFSTGTFTIEGFFRFSATPTNCILLTSWGGGWAFWFESGKLYFRDGNLHDSGQYTWSPTLNTWYHIAVDRDASNVIRIYVDGVMQVKTTGYNYDIPVSATSPAIGSLRNGGFTGFDFNGWMDEIRVTKGVARYGSDGGLTVPTTAFPRS